MPVAIVHETSGQITLTYVAADLTITLEELASKVVPQGAPWRVVDTADLPPGNIEAWTANFDDQPCVVRIDEERLAASLEPSPRETLETWFQSAIDEGFGYGEDIRLGLTTEDVALLTGNYVLAKECHELGLPLPPVIDKSGTSHTLDFNDLTALMLEYGQYRAQLSADYAAQRAAIEAATPNA